VSDPIPGTTVDIDPRSARELDEPIHLIIADDDPQTRELLAQTLTDLGFQVVAEASDGTEGQQVRQFDPEVVLMDMRMPDIGGLRAAQMIKAERPRTQVLILSGYSDEFAALDPELAGVATLLGKNLPLEEIADAIRAAAATYRSSAPDHL